MLSKRAVPGLAIALALGLAACGSGDTGGGTNPSIAGETGVPDSAAPAASGDVGSPATSGDAGSGAGALTASGNIFAFGVSYKTSDEIAQGRIDLFKKHFPDVKVTFSESDFDSQGFLAALQGSDPPDVVRIPRDRLGTYVARGVLAPLTDCLAKTGVDLGGYR